MGTFTRAILPGEDGRSAVVDDLTVSVVVTDVIDSVDAAFGVDRAPSCGNL